jgi:hypothetical protein
MASDYELCNMVTSGDVHALEYTTSWQSYYNRIASRLKSGYTSPAAMKKAMDKIVEYAIAETSSDMRFSFMRLMGWGTTVGASFVPPGKVFALPSQTMVFARRAIKAFGLADRSDVVERHRNACSFAGLITTPGEMIEKLPKDVNKEISKENRKILLEDEDLQQFILDELEDEFGKEFAANVVEEAVHLKPFLGQAISMLRGWTKSGEQTTKALAYIRQAAQEYHQRVFVTIAVAENMPPKPLPPLTPALRKALTTTGGDKPGTLGTSWLESAGNWGTNRMVGLAATAFMIGATGRPGPDPKKTVETIQMGWNLLWGK